MNQKLTFLLGLFLVLASCKTTQVYQKPRPVDVEVKGTKPVERATSQTTEKTTEGAIGNTAPSAPEKIEISSGEAVYKISTSFINNYRPKQSDLNALEYRKKVHFNPRLAKADFKSNSKYYDLTSGKETVLRSRLGKKYLVEGEPLAFTVEKTTETKSIMGYECHKMIGKRSDGLEAEVYYTTALKAKYNPVFPTDGFTTMYVLKSQNKRSTYTVQSITPKEIEDRDLKMDGMNKISQEAYEKGAFNGLVVGFMKGEQALDFERPDLAGEQVSPSNLKGKVVVMNFWFAACSPCKEEVPEFIRLKEQYKDKEVEFVAVTYDSYNVAKSFVDASGFNFRIVPNSKDILDAYKILIYPTTMVLDKNGVVQSIIEKPTNAREVGREIDKYLYR